MRIIARDRRVALGLFLALIFVYNANGREIGSYDTQPQKYTARELAVIGTTRLSRVVEEVPALGDRVAFARDRRGHFRSAYPILPGLLAAIPASLLHWTGAVDMQAPLAPYLVAALTASLLTAAAVALTFLMLRRLVSLSAALWTAVGLGLGTGYWPIASQSLWQHGPVIFGLSLCLFAWVRPTALLRPRHLWLGGLGLAMAGAARPVVSVVVAILLLWIGRRVGVRRALPAAVPVALLAGASIYGNVHWFGDILGALPVIESVHQQYHAVSGPLGEQPWTAALGLLISPSRGLLVYSPLVLVALFGVFGTAKNASVGLPWLFLAFFAQFGVYSVYAVWWGGHTYGPRYLVDVLPLLAPAAALGVARLQTSRWLSTLAGLLLCWSVVVAGAGAFIYPNEEWNTSPRDVDLYHDRLWDVRDNQIIRTLQADPSPQNFQLFSRNAFRRPPE